jgi:hypothetical protein
VSALALFFHCATPLHYIGLNLNSKGKPMGNQSLNKQKKMKERENLTSAAPVALA